MITIKTPQEIELMRKSCALARDTLVMIEEHIRPGISTDELNQICHNYILSHNAYPSPLNYRGFPKSICTSLNNVICHGIPSPKDILCEGDLLNVDVTTYLNKFHGDTNKTFLVGEVKSKKIKELVEITYRCMWAGIEQIRPRANFGDIGEAISQLAGENGVSVVEDYCGHGIGREFHEDPPVLHVGVRGEGPVMKEGMTFTVEPMINLGRKETKILSDGWTVVTMDGSISAQFEHTILVTASGYEVLTLRPEEKNN